MREFILHLADGCCGIDIEATSKRIGSLIERSGLNDKELSERMNVSVQAINKWRHGKGFPDIENLCILSRILGYTVDDLLVFQWKDRIILDITLEERKKAYLVSEIMRKYYFMIAAIVHSYNNGLSGKQGFKLKPEILAGNNIS